jgi:DNA repair exonuclease SbcCD ATPase subunit
MAIGTWPFLWPAISGGHPAGRRCATLKICTGKFLLNYLGLECAPLSVYRRCAALSQGKATGIFISDVRKLTQLGYNYSAFRKS